MGIPYFIINEKATNDLSIHQFYDLTFLFNDFAALPDLIISYGTTIAVEFIKQSLEEVSTHLGSRLQETEKYGNKRLRLSARSVEEEEFVG